jgi:hypothetical protein
MNIRVPNAIDLSVQESGREYNRVSASMNDYMMEKRSGRIKKDFLDKD